MLNILTRPPQIFFKGALKHYAARVATVFGRVRGPASVLASVKRGLVEIEYPHVINSRVTPNQVVHVLSNIEALRYSISAKKSGKIKRLIAGPNLVILPTDHKKIIESPEIDALLVPSFWVRDMYIQLSPVLSKKIHIWPAGVEINPPSNRKGGVVIYDKILDKKLLEEIKLETEKYSGKPPLVFTYGSFKRRDYLKALTTASTLIYLSRSESQGLALFEAWSYDVPTLVNHSELWETPDHRWQAPLINAPYLNDELGYVFQSPSDISGLLGKAEDLHPKLFCDQNFSNVVSARKLLELL